MEKIMENKAEMELCLKEIKEVEKELDVHLTLLAKNVDKGFAQLRELNKQMGKIADEVSEMGHPKLGGVIAVAGIAFSGVAGAYNEIKAASAHNEALQRLMEQKVKIAKEKSESIKKIRPKAVHSYGRLINLLDKELNREYIERDMIDNPENAEIIAGEIARVSALYKSSCYALAEVDYLIAEYNAWSHYQQKSKLPRPIMSHVNNALFDNVFRNDSEYDLSATITRTRTGGKISGAELLFLSDPSLTSCLLFDYMNDGNCVKDLGLKPEGIADVFLSDNEAYKEYTSSLSETNHWWLSPAIGVGFTVIASIVFDYFCFGWIDSWWAFFRWIAYIVIVGIELVITAGVLSSINEEEIKQKICNKAAQKQLDHMGYVEIYEPDLEEKNLLAAGAKGLLKGLFS